MDRIPDEELKRMAEDKSEGLKYETPVVAKMADELIQYRALRQNWFDDIDMHGRGVALANLLTSLRRLAGE